MCTQSAIGVRATKKKSSITLNHFLYPNTTLLFLKYLENVFNDLRIKLKVSKV